MNILLLNSIKTAIAAITGAVVALIAWPDGPPPAWVPLPLAVLAFSAAGQLAGAALWELARWRERRRETAAAEPPLQILGYRAWDRRPGGIFITTGPHLKYVVPRDIPPLPYPADYGAPHEPPSAEHPDGCPVCRKGYEYGYAPGFPP